MQSPVDSFRLPELAASRQTPPRVPAARLHPRGFTFTEILFAVMILGIGFIMVAAMFPVAIAQTQANSHEAVAAAVARGGAGYLDRIAATTWPPGVPAGTAAPSVLLPTFPTAGVYPDPTTVNIPVGQSTYVLPGQVWSFQDLRDNQPDVGVYVHRNYLWSLLSGNLIVPADPRFAWVALYKRDLIYQGPPGGQAVSYTLAPYAQVIVIGVQASSKSVYDASDVNPAAAFTSLKPVLLRATITGPTNADDPSTVTFATGSDRIADNAYLVVSESATARDQFVGRIFRLGAFDTVKGIWQLRPGSDLTASDLAVLKANSASSLTCDVFVVGRGIDPGSTANPPSAAGAAQDITAYTTFVQVSH